MKTKILLFAAFLTLLISSCKKKDYQPAGNYVTAGTNVNTIVHEDFEVYSWDWNYNSLYKEYYYRRYTSQPYGTVVLCYVLSGKGKQAMPYLESYPTAIQYNFADNLFDNPAYIELQYTNISSPTTAPTSNEYFYLVFLPPGSREANPSLDFTNYEAVKKAFNLKD